MKIDFLKKEIWDLMRTIQVSKDMVMFPVAKDYPITPLQLRILMEVNVSENLSLNRLAKVMDMNNGNVSIAIIPKPSKSTLASGVISATP